MTNKSGQRRTNNLMDELIGGWIQLGNKRSVYQQNDVAVIDIFNEKRKCCNHRRPDSIYIHTLLLIIYLSAIDTLICHREMSLIGSVIEK